MRNKKTVRASSTKSPTKLAVTTKVSGKKAVPVATKRTVTNSKVVSVVATKEIGKLAAAKLLRSNKGKLGTAKFTSKEKGEREIRFRVLAEQPNKSLGYVAVRDVRLAKTQPKDCIRTINLQTLSFLQFGKDACNVK